MGSAEELGDGRAAEVGGLRWAPGLSAEWAQAHMADSHLTAVSLLLLLFLPHGVKLLSEAIASCFSATPGRSEPWSGLTL